MEDGSKNAVRKVLLCLCLLGQFLVVSVRQGKAAAAGIRDLLSHHHLPNRQMWYPVLLWYPAARKD